MLDPLIGVVAGALLIAVLWIEIRRHRDYKRASSRLHIPPHPRQGNWAKRRDYGR